MTTSKYLVLFLCFVALAGRADSPARLSFADRSRLAGMVTDKVPEIRQGRIKALEKNARLATYGGTSREINDFVERKVNELGGVAAFERWLDAQPAIHLLDWHRIASDLDFLLIPKEGTATPERAAELSRLGTEIEAQFPGTVFYSKFDIHTAPEFFKTFPPGNYHFEATSNIPISERGVEILPELEVTIDGRPVHLTRWGMEQFEQGRLDFRLTAGPDAAAGPGDDLLKQLRWVRYLAERPDMTLSEQGKKAMRELKARILGPHRRQLIALLKQGDASYKEGNHRGEAEKLIASLEKLQLYSRDSEATHALLADHGIIELARAAGIEERRILKPLPRLDPETRRRLVAGKKPIGHELALNHRTSLAAAQNISFGALWISDNRSVIRGKVTTAAYGDGIYAAPGVASLSFGDMYVTMTLRADAVEGVDFLKAGDYYVLLHRDAVSKIQHVDRDALVGDFARKLAPGGSLSKEEKETALRSLSTLLAPETHPGDFALFQLALEGAKELGKEQEFLSKYFERTGVVRSLLRADSAFARRMQGVLAKLIKQPPWSGFDDKILAEVLSDHDSVSARLPGIARQVKELIVTMPAERLASRELFSSPAAMRALRAKWPERWKAALHASVGNDTLASFAWNLTDPVELALLKEIDASIPAGAVAESEAFERKMEKEYPRGRSTDWGFRAEFIRDVDQRAMYWDLKSASRKRHAIDSALNGARDNDLETFLRLFPDSRVLAVEAGYSYSGDPNDRTIVINGPREVARLLNALREGVTLTAAQERLLQAYLRRGDPHFLGLLVDKCGPRGQAIAIADAKSRRGLEGAKRLALYFHAGEEPGVGYRPVPGSPLSKALIEDKAWHADVRAHLLDPAMPVAAVEHFPWDLGDAADVEMLRALFSRKPGEALAAFRDELEAAGGPQFDSYSDALDPARIKDAVLRDRYVKLRREYRLAKAAKELDRRLQGDETVAYKNIFAPGVKWLPIEMERYLADVKEKGADPAPVFAWPFNAESPWKHREYLQELLKGEKLPLVIERFRSLPPGDSVASWLQLLHGSKALRLDGEFRNRVRARFAEELKGARSLHDLSYYPWDLHDPKDVALLRQLDASVARNAVATHEALTNRLKREYPRTVYQDGDFGTRFLPERLPPAERAPYRAVEENKSARAMIDSVLQGLRDADFEAFLREFSDHDGLVSVKGGGLSHEKKIYVEGPAAAAKLLNDLRDGKTLVPPQEKLLALYLSRGDSEFLSLLLRQTGPRGEALAIAAARKLRGLAGAKRAMALFRASDDPGLGYRPQPESPLAAALRNDPEWRADLRKYIFDPSIPSAAAEHFPWDAHDAADLAALKDFLPLDEKAEYEALFALRSLLERREGHRIGYSLTDLDPDHIKDGTLKKEFVGLRRRYLLSKASTLVRQTLYGAPGAELDAAIGRGDLTAILAAPFNKESPYKLDTFYREQLEKGGAARRMVLARLAELRPGDSMISWMRMISQFDKTKTARKEISVWDEVRTRFVAELAAEKRGDSFLYYPWDLRDPIDAALLRQLDTSAPAGAYEAHQRLEERYKLDHPDTVVKEKIFDRTEYRFYPDKLPPDKRAAYHESHRLSERRQHLDGILRTCRDSDFDSFVAAFPGHPLLAYSYGYSPKAALDIVAALKEGKALSPDQERWLQILLDHGETGFLRALVFQAGPAGEQLAIAHGKAGRGPRAARMVMVMLGGADVGHSYPVVTDSPLRAALREDAAWRSDVRSHLLDPKMPTTALALFPWDLNDARDVQILKPLLAADSEMLTRRLRELRKEIEKRGGPAAQYYDDSLDAEQIEDAVLRKEYAALQREYRIAKGARAAIPELRKQGPAKFGRLFGAIAGDSYSCKEVLEGLVKHITAPLSPLRK